MQRFPLNPSSGPVSCRGCRIGRQTRFDNYRRYINGVDPHSPDKTLNVTAVGVLHTTKLP